MTLTATPDEVVILDAVATNLVRDWSALPHCRNHRKA